MSPKSTQRLWASAADHHKGCSEIAWERASINLPCAEGAECREQSQETAIVSRKKGNMARRRMASWMVFVWNLHSTSYLQLQTQVSNKQEDKTDSNKQEDKLWTSCKAIKLIPDKSASFKNDSYKVHQGPIWTYIKLSHSQYVIFLSWFRPRNIAVKLWIFHGFYLYL